MWRIRSATGAPIVALVAIVVLFAFALLSNFARQQDQAFADTTSRLVESALHGRAEAVEGIAVDYAIWNDAYVATTRRLDLAWLESNFYSNAVDALFIMDGEGRILYAWTSDATNAEILQTEASALPASVNLPALLRSGDANAITLSTRALAGETPALIAVTPISAERDGVLLPRDPERPARYLAAFDLLSGNELSALGESLQIEGLHFDAAAGTHERQHPSAPHLPLSPDGAIGAIAWTLQTPGSDALAGQVGASIAVLVLLGLAAFALAARLANMHLAANARTEAAEETSRLRAEFVAEVHEQVNGPLNTLVGYAELIEEQAEDLGPEAHNIRNDAQQMRAAAQDLSQLLHGAMRHARIDGGRITLVSERVETLALLEEMRELTAASARNANASISIEVDDDARELASDPVRLQQCLVQLCLNALERTADRQVRVRARRSKERDGAYVSFEFADSGPAVEPERAKSLFKPFQDSGTGSSGDGFSLSTTQGLARLMAGDVRVANQAGGVVFSLIVPAPIQSFGAHASRSSHRAT